MAPLKGNNLGEKHQSYNQLLKETIAKGPTELQKINYDEDDVENMLRIDIACKERNVNYIMEVLKCDDMFYVSRAIKHSEWLITEREYAHLINPYYLQSNLFPEMTAKATAKLMLHIRRHLKNEKRAEAFFTWVYEKNPNMALKWLENCSMRFTEEIVARNPNRISPAILKRLCKRSVDLLAVYVKNFDISHGYIECNDAMFLLKNHTLEFISIIESIPSWKFHFPSFNKKCTQIIMSRCFDRIIQNFRYYQSHIHLPTFVKFLKRNHVNIESFLLTKCEKCWLSFDNLKPFLDELPQSGNVNLLTNLYAIKEVSNDVESTHDVSDDSDAEDSDGISTQSNDSRTELEELFFRIEYKTTFSNEYRWYEFVPFEKAFQDLQKLIYAESSPDERQHMLIVLLKCARKDVDLVRRVLQYYHDKHINESYIQKIKFINSLLTLHDAFRFEDTTWNILNELFHSLEVYIESTNKVQQCLDTIILYKIIHAQPVHEIVEQKLAFHTFKDMQKKLNLHEREKLFNYLYNTLVTKLRTQDIDRETGLKQAVELMKNLWTLIKDWKRESVYRQFDIDHIILLSNANKQSSWNIDMRCLYHLVKPYHRPLFENSLILHPCEEVCIRALKHDPGLLVRFESEVAELCKKVSLRKFLSKLRIYWRDSLDSEWKNTFINNLQDINGHKVSVKGIFVLSSRTSLIDFIKTHAPKEGKIKWTDDNKVQISLQKNIAKNMHIARPQLPIEVVLLYANEDYLKYVLFSVNSIYLNMRPNDIKKNVELLLCAPVSLQKHGIRLACALLKTEQLLDTFASIWKSTTNLSIRNIIFQTMFGFLRKVEDSLVEDTWKVLSFMIDDLNYKENKNIYETLGKVEQVPVSIIAEYYKKCYLFLRDMPKSVGLEKYFNTALEYATEVIQYLDSDFVESTILVSIYDIFIQKNKTLMRILVAYLLCSKDTNTQLQKYKSLFDPLFKRCAPEWKNNKFQSNIVAGFQNLLTNIERDLSRFVFEMKMVIPVEIVANIQNELESQLCKNELYGVITHWKLSAAYIELLNDMFIEKPESYNDWEKLRAKSINAYSKICLKYLKEDIKSQFPSIYMLFADALKQTCQDFGIEKENFLKLLNGMLISEDEQVYLLVLGMMPTKYSGDEREKIRIICRKLQCFPSKEIRMHFYAKYNKRYDTEEYEEDSESDSEDSEQDEVSGDDNSGSGYETSESENLSGDDGSQRSKEGNDVAPVTYKWRCDIV